MRVVILCIGAIVGGSGVAIATAAFAEDSGYTYRHAAWRGAAYVDDKSHAFSHCMVERAFPDKSSIAFAVSRDYDFHIVLENPAWRMVPDTRLPVRLSVDGRALGLSTAVALTPTLLVLDGGGEGRFQAVKAGRELAVDTGLGELHFPLKGSSMALDKTLDCVAAATAFTDPRAVAVDMPVGQQASAR